MSFHDLIISDIKTRIFRPDTSFDTVIYIPVSNTEDIDAIVESFDSTAFSAVAVECSSWNDMLTPWKAPAAFSNGDSFGGKADLFLVKLKNDIIPEAEALTGTPDFRGIAGYSLAGLFALYAFYTTDLFDLCGCVSGSVWYDGFEDWALERFPVSASGSIFFSLGNKEEKTRNQKMQHTGQIMRNICEKLNETDSYDASFRYTRGNHFEGHTQRMNECLSWLLGL